MQLSNSSRLSPSLPANDTGSARDTNSTRVAKTQTSLRRRKHFSAEGSLPARLSRSSPPNKLGIESLLANNDERNRHSHESDNKKEPGAVKGYKDELGGDQEGEQHQCYRQHLAQSPTQSRNFSYSRHPPTRPGFLRVWWRDSSPPPPSSLNSTKSGSSTHQQPPTNIASPNVSSETPIPPLGAAEAAATMSDDDVHLSSSSLASAPSSPAPSMSKSRGKKLARRSLVRKAGEASLRVNSGIFSGTAMAAENDIEGVSEVEGQGHEEGEEEGVLGLSFDESEMRMRLGDLESSFLPELAMAGANESGSRNVDEEGLAGRDDTYLELADPGRTPAVRREKIPSSDEVESPLAAVVERKVAGTRNIESSISELTVPKSGSRNSTMNSGSTVQPEYVALPQSQRSSVLTADSVLSGLKERKTSRRNGLTNRQASYQSVDSSLTLGSDLSSSDGMMNADIALQTRGAVSNNASMRIGRRKNLLQRLPSLGSVSSQMTGDEPRDISAPSLLASRLRSRAHDRDDEERPETPRASTSNFRAPTDTVVAQHVQSIQVPDTIARDFLARNPLVFPDKRPTSAGGLVAALRDRPKKNLTLKEQNNKIDKLTKENFDLKLKIHFLDQALQNRSDDGIKDLIEKNVQFQTDLAGERKESQSLRRKVKELERKLKEQEEGLAEARNGGYNQESEYDDPTLQGEMHEEILLLRQRLDRSENRVTTLTEEVMTKDFEKRKMAEHMRSMVGKRGEDTAGVEETIDMWQDLLNAETGRREQAEEDLNKLRDELNALRLERASPITRRTEMSNSVNGALAGSNAAALEQLKHENSDLRRDLGAQTSMLTSRNRERERLQQEIEDLKLMFRKGDGIRSVTGESIFERSISRAHQRSASRASAHTDVTEAERDEWEKKEGLLRDQNAELRIKFQDLERTHNTHLQYVTVIESDYRDMENDLAEVQEDLLKLQSERDEALHAFDQQEVEYEQLREEALAEISALDDEKKILEAQLDDAMGKAHRLQAKLQNTSDGYKGVQGELRDITQSVINLEDEKQANMRTIQALEQQIAEAEDEIQKWERKCSELDEKNRKLEVTQESLHSEITFLREEQEGDKIKIGELEDALNAARQTIQDEHERMREMEDSILEERQQRDVLEDQSKEEVQKVLDDLNSENTRTKDELRKLRRSLSTKEVEASTWKQRLEELEEHLRQAIGDPDGTRQSLLADIERLQRDMENTASELDRAKMDLADKDRLLRHRDGLLESTSLESRRLSDLLDKERASRKHDLDQFDKASRGQATHMRTIAQQESKLLEVETAYGQDKRRMVTLDQQYREQLRERNNLLLALWHRLSTLCGVDWAQNHSLINGENPSVEVINKHLSGFSSNIISAVKTIETLIGNFKVRIRGVEKDLSRDYQTLEHNLDIRIRRMEIIERTVKETQQALATADESSQRSALTRATSTSKTSKNTEEISRLKTEIKLLKSELKASRQQQQQSSTSRRTPTSPAKAIASLLRHNSSSSSSVIDRRRPTSSALSDFATDGNQDPQQQHQQQQQVVSQPSSSGAPPQTEQRWIYRLKEMERRLKAEREARLLDREGARVRLVEGRQENEELRIQLERARAGGGGDGGANNNNVVVVSGSEREGSERGGGGGARNGNGNEKV